MQSKRKEYVSNEHDYFEVGNGFRHTLKRVPEMMDTPPIRNNCAFIILTCREQEISYFYSRVVHRAKRLKFCHK